MKTSIQKQFDILMIAAQVGCTKLEAIAAVKGWSFKTLTAEKAEEIKDAVAKITAKRSTKLRKSAGKTARRNGRKAPFQRFAGSLLGLQYPVKGHTSRPSVASKVAEVLIASAKPIAAFRAAASKVQGWTKEVAALNAAYQDAVAAAKSAVAAL